MENRTDLPELIGQSKAFLDALDHASSIADIDRPVLVVGERGSGKELFAGRIHFLSRKWDGPFIKVNCAAMTETLLESELFGHEAGAFTGATKKHLGRFERAEGGSLFLDEISSASLRIQEKLLRVIEYGEFERVGGNATLSANVRIIAAANVDLRQQVARGEFRADLLDRLAFDVVGAPALRHRPEDIPTLAAHFATRMAKELDISFPGFAHEAIQLLRAHDWPGNVRELKNVAERATYSWAQTMDTVQIEQITIDPFEKIFGATLPESLIETTTPPGSGTATLAPVITDEIPNGVALRDHLDAIERRHAENALSQTAGNQKRAAERLGLTYDQFRGIMRKHQLDAADYH